MKFKSSILAQASGSVGGSTYSHNRGGMYIRNRSIPVNVNSTQQQAVRNAIVQLSTAWADTLTAQQRADWQAYSDAVLLPDALGDMRNVGGRQHYIRANTPRLQAGVTAVDAGPATLALPTFTNPSVAVNGTSDQVAVTFTTADDWANEVGGYMLVYCSRPQPPTVNSFKGPYRYAGKIVGAGSPPASPANIALPFLCTAGQKIFVRIEIIRADGRLSGSFRAGAVAT